VGTLPVEGRDEAKQTNEIKMAAPLLETIEIKGKVITGDALLAQRELARHLVEDREADYHFTVKGNQKGVLDDIEFYFRDRGAPHYVEQTPPDHGRIETRKIWTTTELNSYLEFPYVGQAFVIERHAINKKTGKESLDIAYGITSQTPEKANPAQVLETNRGHWAIENSCHYIIDWNFDEDRSRIRVGYGPENMTRMRRFAVSLIKTKLSLTKPNAARNVAQFMRRMNPRKVFDLLRMTENSQAKHVPA
jgi:predicted transposase YbfD/YdcC